MAKAKKTKSGKWRVLVYDYTDDNKKRHYKSFTADTKKEAEYMAAEYLMTSRRGETSYANMTLREAYGSYIKSKSSVLSPSTIAGYERSKKNHFQKLMPVVISQITPQMVQIAVNEMAADHSPKSVRNAHGLLHAVLRTFVPRLELNTRLPQKIKPQYTIPTSDEIRQLLSSAPDAAKVPIMLAAYGGLRRSEICALTPEDFTEFGVNINKAAVYSSDNKVIIKTTKTLAGTRFVPLPPEVIKAALAWKNFGATPATVSNQFCRALKNSGLPKFSFHKLRHFFASELHAQGIPDQYIATVGGWESVDMLHRIYQHTLRDKQSEIEQKIVDIFSAKTSSTTQNATQAK